MFERAVIYLPPDVEHPKWLSRCLEHCERRDYRVVGIVQSPAGWPAVHEMLTNGEAEVVVVGRFGQLDPGRVPRLEEAVDYGTSAGRRRPRTFRRG